VFIMVRIKRVYHRPSPTDGLRLLVDRVWPRGCKKDLLRLDAWRKDLAPSSELRKWFGHDPQKWPAFCARYRKELQQPEAHRAIEDLAGLSRKQTITLVFGSVDTTHNQAVILKEMIERAGG